MNQDRSQAQRKYNRIDLISLQEASKLCPYSQEYLSLRARQKKLRAVKLGRNWFTTQEWLFEYIRRVQEFNLSKTRVATQTKPLAQAEQIKQIRPLAERKAFAKQKKTRVAVIDVIVAALSSSVSLIVSAWAKIVEKIVELLNKEQELLTLGLLKYRKVISNRLNRLLLFISKSIDEVLFVFFDLLNELWGSAQWLTRLVSDSFIKGLNQIGCFLEWLANQTIDRLGQIHQKLNNLFLSSQRVYYQPNFAFILVLVVLVLLNLGLLVSPQYGERLFVSASQLNTRIEKTLSGALNQTPDLIIGLGQAPFYISKKAASILSSLDRFLAQAHHNLVVSYYLADQKNEQYKIVVKEKVIQSLAAVSGLPARVFTLIEDIGGQLAILVGNKDVYLIRIETFFHTLSDRAVGVLGQASDKVSVLLLFVQKSWYWAEQQSQAILIAVQSLPQRMMGILNNVGDTLTTLSDIPRMLSDTSKSLEKKLIFSAGQMNQAIESALSRMFSDIGRNRAKLADILPYLRYQISRQWDEFSQINLDLSQKVASTYRKIKDKLGDAYLRIVLFFEGTSPDTDEGLVYQDRDIRENINSLEESILEDIQGRFDDFRDNLGISSQKKQKEGVVVVPVEKDEKTAKQRLKELTSAFSDEVKIESDQTGRSGVIEPVFQQAQTQRYLYMMVPVNEGE